MSAHTKGEWRAVKRPRIGFAEWSVAWSPDDELVCDIVYSEADALLIAAAPELLAALVAARTELEQWSKAESGEFYNNPTMNAAISKALGPVKL